MITNDAKLAVRNMLKHKGYTLINVIGLSMGLSLCLLIFLWVQDELQYDRFHAKAGRIYRALWEARYGDNEWKIPRLGVPLAETLEKEFPEVERAARLYPGGFTLRHGDDYVREERVLFVEPSFFEVFTVSFLSGNPQTALQNPEAVVLTAETAQRYFPGRNPMGQTLARNDGKLLHVTGVVMNYPAQSHFHFDFLASLDLLPFIEDRRTSWGSATVYTYFVLRPGESAATLETKLQTYVDNKVADEDFRRSGNYTRYPLQPLSEIHLESHLQYELEANGNIAYVYLFSAIACIVLLVACFNFVNLATAQATTRAREVGVRKVLGSQRLQLIRQFFLEAFLHVVLAIGVAVALAELVLPSFNAFAGKQLAIGLFTSPLVATMLLVLAVAVTALAGTYPAMVLSSFRPARVLKGRLTTGSRRDWLRQVLVVAQFCISIGLIAGTLVVRRQLEFVQNQHLGFDKEHVIILHRAGALGKRYHAFRDRLAGLPPVADASVAQNLPGQEFDSTIFEPEQPSNYQQSSLTYAWVDPHYADVLKLKFVAGRNFSNAFPTDSSAFIINQTAAKALGWKEPLGKRLSGYNTQGPVIGVVEDFHFESLHHEVKPILLLFNRWAQSYVAVRLRPGPVGEGIAAIQTLWKEFAPNAPFQYSFLDENYQKLYFGEQRVARVFTLFSVLAVIIACLGLFGLASFTAAQRTKEMGIRKVLGATAAGIVGLLSQEFVRLVLLANVIAWPVAYYGMHKWLQGFAYRTAIGWEVFATAGGVALAVAMITVSTQALKAALANPVEALRYE